MNNRRSASLLCVVVLLLGACHKRAATPIPTVPPRLDDFQLAEQQFEAGDYAAAARLYSQYLQQDPPAGKKERALFRLALAYALPGSALYQPAQAIMCFKQLLALVPQSVYRHQIQVILGLHAELEKARAENRAKEGQIKVLNGELEKLKKIDMQTRPYRPPE